MAKGNVSRRGFVRQGMAAGLAAMSVPAATFVVVHKGYLMTFTTVVLSVVISGALSACTQLSQAESDPYPAAHPPAGIQPRRPATYVPYTYSYSSEELLKMDGPKMETLAKQAWADIKKVNAQGPYSNTIESLAKHECPEWFKDAKLGMFIDWGPWSV